MANDLNTEDICARWNKMEEDNFISNLNINKINHLSNTLFTASQDFSKLTKEDVNTFVKDTQDILIEADKY